MHNETEIKQYKLATEANIVASIYQRPSVLEEIDITIDDISDNRWKVYYAIAYGIIIKENKKVIDDVTCGLYLDKHPKLKEKYIEYGGYDTVKKFCDLVEPENVYGYIEELKKWNACLLLAKNNIYIDDLSKLADYTSEDIYNLMDVSIQDAFLRVDTKAKMYDITDGIDDLIEELDKGEDVGMEFYGSDLLTEAVGGISMNKGCIYGIGASTGVGKTSTFINLVLPSCLKHEEPIVIMMNEEDQTRIQKEMLVWIANNVFKGYVDTLGTNRYVSKKDLRDGHFSNELKNILYKSAQYLKDMKKKHIINIIPLERYTFKSVKKIIKKYAKMGVKLFVLDTLKSGSDVNVNQKEWEVVAKDVEALYDLVKPVNLNVTLILTYQLAKSATKTRHLSNDDVGRFKNILDVMDVNIMLRKPFPDEYEGQSHALKAYNTVGKTNIPYNVDMNKYYMITFINKNRRGETDSYQILSEFDQSKNIHKDVAKVKILNDW